MSNYKKKEVMAYLTRKPVTSEDIKIAASSIQSSEERLIQQQPFYQQTPELVQDDIARPQTGSIPLYQNVQPGIAIQETLPTYAPPDMAPTMPSAKDVPNPQFNILELADGGRASFEQKQKILKDIKKYVDKKLSKKEIVTLSELNEKFGEGKRREYLYKEALGKDYDKITKLQREGVGRVSLEVKDKLYNIIDDVVKGKRPLMDLSRKNLNEELPPVSERQLSKYLNENKQYKDYELASNVDKVQQRIAKGNEKLKDATLKNIESQLELTTANLRRPSPRRIEEFIVRDLVRHDNQGGELFKVLPSSNTKFYDKIKILDVTNDEILTAKRIKDLVDKNDPRFKEYKDTFEEINQLKKTPYVDPVTKEETNLLKALQQATGNKQPLNIDHLESVKDNPLNKLAVSTFKANTGANIKDITEEELSMLGRKKFTPEQNIERLTKFADRRLLQEAASGFEKVKTPLETLAIKRSSTLFSDPTGVGTFLETSAGQMLSKSAPNLLKAASRLSTATGTPINALLGVALNAEEFKGKGLSDLETIAAGAYKGSTQDLLNFGDLIFRKLPIAAYEKFVEDKPFLESLLNKPEYFEFADKQIDKYASEKSIQDRIQNRAEYEVRKSLPINVSDTEVPNTITSEEFKNLVETKKNEILNSNPDLKNLYEQEQTIPIPKEKTTSQNLMLGPIVFPKYTQEELNLAYGGRVKYANGTQEDDLYIPPLNKPDITIREGVLSLATGGRVNFAGGGKYTLPLEALRKIDNVLLQLKNNLFISSMKEKSEGKNEAIKWTTKNWIGLKESPKDNIFKQVEDLKQTLPKEYHSTLEDIKNLTDKTEYIKAKQTLDALDDVIDPNLRFSNLPKDQFPMTDPLNDAFIITDPKSGIMAGRYVTSMSIDPETGRGIRQTFDRWDPENKVIIKDRTQWKLQGVESIEKGKEGLN